MRSVNSGARHLLRALSVVIIGTATATMAQADDPVVPGDGGCGRPYCNDVLVQNKDCTLNSGPLCGAVGTCNIQLGGDCISYIVFQKTD